MLASDDCISAASFWHPTREGRDSGWAEHAPFAFWLIDALRPKVAVELGVYKGYSYSAFCQAVRKLQIDTRCYGIDTWQGDDHAGFYEEAVYADLSAYHNEHYASFSRLIRATFDEALLHFADGSIDLLHIDGRHFYEDVAHDFQTWIPKLSPNAIVLFHDTNVRERGFGVCRLWREISSRYLSFEFLHGNGLGVIGMGVAPTEAMQRLFRSNERHIVSTREIYSRLGSSISDRYAVMLNSQRAELNGSRVAGLEQDLQVAKAATTASESALAYSQTCLAQKSIKLDQMNSRVSKLNAEVEALRSGMVKLRESFEQSTSWRISYPVRMLKNIFSRDRLP